MREENECVHLVKIETFIREKKNHSKIHTSCRRTLVEEEKCQENKNEYVHLVKIETFIKEKKP